MSRGVYDKVNKRLIPTAGNSIGGGGQLITVDDSLSTISTNPVQNKIITEALANYALQVDTIPTPGVDYIDKVIQYVGSTNNNYIRGEFYECIATEQSNDPLTYTYSWKSLGIIFQFDTLPTASETWLNKIVQFTGQTPYTNGYFYKCVLNNGIYEWIEWSVMRVTGNTPMLVDVSGASVEREFRVVTIRWTDPENSTINGQTIAEWGGTKLVRKVGSAPQNEEDGTLLVNSTTKNQYSTTGFVDNTVEYDVVYYYRFFPYSTINVVTKGTAISVNCQRELVPIPTQSGTLTFNNTTQSPTLSNTAHFTTSGQTSAKNAGTYEITCSLESDDYRWSDGSATDKVVSWSIGKASGVLTPSKTNIVIGEKNNIFNVSFSDLYGREILSAVSSDSTKVSASTDGVIVTLRYVGLGSSVITVTTNSSNNAEIGTAIINVSCIHQIIYGFQIDGNESDPLAAVSYLSDCDNYGYTPAHMDFANDVFNYGSWYQDEFFMPKPCMLNYDGTVAYYLDPNDYTKKIDGITPSDVADSNFSGNAMMEWGRDGFKIWYKVVPFNSNKSGKIYIANYQVNNDYVDFSFHDCNGNSADHFYTPIYNGSVINGTMRSLSGQQISKNTTAQQEVGYATANNTGASELWNIENIADRMLINFLLILISKSTDTQSVFGKGLIDDGGEGVNNGFRSGVHNDKGMFYGTNSGSASVYTNAVKVFGMENYWGFQWRRTNGLINSGGTQLVKYCYGQEDGSNTSGYNFDGTDYINTNMGPGGSNGGYVSEMVFTNKGMFNRYMGGSNSTYFCDVMFFNNSGTQFALVGGNSHDGLVCGAFGLDLSDGPGHSSWGQGAALSCKPLKEEEEKEEE